MPRCNPAPRKEARSLSSSGSWRASDLWYGRTMCMMELAIKTMTADSRIGSQRAARKSIGDLFLSNWNGRIKCEAILFLGHGQGRGVSRSHLEPRRNVLETNLPKYFDYRGMPD